MRISDWSSDVCSSDLGKTLVEEGKLITARHIKLIAEANLKQLTVPDTYLVGKVVAKDLVAEGTGEIIAAANTELTQVLLAKARESGIKILPTLFINDRSEEHTSELQSLMRISYAVFCLKKKKNIIYPLKTETKVTQKIANECQNQT